MDTVQVTFYLAIATFILAFFAAVSAGITAWMACETRKYRKLMERKYLSEIQDMESIQTAVKEDA